MVYNALNYKPFSKFVNRRSYDLALSVYYFSVYLKALIDAHIFCQEFSPNTTHSVALVNAMAYMTRQYGGIKHCVRLLAENSAVDESP